MSVVRLQGLTLGYGSRRGIEDVSLDVPEGARFGFLGPNGAGKTTTIRVMLGFMRAGRGLASIFGLDCWRDSAEIKRQVGYVPGDLRMYGWMNLVEGLALLSRLHGRDLREAGMRVGERLGLDARLRVSAMSRGTRQKLGLALALAPDPRLLVLDEPTSALDPLVQETVLDMLRERAAAGRTIFFSSHTLREVETLCDRVAVVRDGRVVEDATVEELRARARRHVRVALPAGVSAPGLLQEETLSGPGVEGWLGGSSTALIAWAAEHQVEDIEIGPPDLDRIFRGYYA